MDKIDVDLGADPSFLDESAGQGFEAMGSEALGTPLLQIAQPLSSVVAEEKIPVGHLYNSVTGRDYGTKLMVTVVHYNACWLEWQPDLKGLAGRHPVHGIPVKGNAYEGGLYAENGNKIVETWLYFCVLPEYPDEAFVVLSSTPGQMKYLKSWNMAMKTLHLPSNKPAPIFAGIWELRVNKDKNKNGQMYYSFNEGGKCSIRFAGWVTKELVDNHVKPLQLTAPTMQLQISAPPTEQAEVKY